MPNAKIVSSIFASHFKVGSKQCISNSKEKEEMRKFSYASAVRSLIYIIGVHEVGLSICS